MSRLTGTIHGGVGQAGAGEPSRAGIKPGLSGAGPANGIEIDGVLYPLEGQPPIARGGNWWPPKRSG